MKKLKLFPKIFIYTFIVMLVVTLAVHFCASNADQYQPLYGKRCDDGKQP